MVLRFLAQLRANCPRLVVPWAGMLGLSLALSLGTWNCSNSGTTKPSGGTGIQFLDADTNTLGETVDTLDGDLSTVTDAGTDTVDTGSTPIDQPCLSDGAWGCTCATNDDCLSGFCIDGEQGKVCTKTCTSVCPTDWKCVQAAGTSDLTYLCVPTYTNLCKPCKTHDDCKALGSDSGQNLCVPNVTATGFVNGSFCGVSCAVGGSCKAGYSCKTVELPGAQTITAQQCVPDSGDCSCLPSWTALQVTTECSKTNEFGTCTATRSCIDAGLTLCTASAPEAEACGDGIDNNCNGQTDEDGAVGCTVYFADKDLDGYGLGQGACLCTSPGIGYSAKGGDCNDLVASIHPGADEICDNIDNNCNGQTDEAGAKGCKIYYKDKDGDGFGDPGDSACLCPSKASKDWIEQAGDCDDTNPDVHPGVVEVCDNIDNNCNAKIDEEGAQGCTLFYLDVDGDTYGPATDSKCLCAANSLYVTDKSGDCDDNNKAVHPGAVEICNNVDDDCNGLTDDGDAPKSCPALTDGSVAACTGGKCVIGGCKKGLFDVDGSYDTGCECQADSNYGIVGGQCAAPIDQGEVPDGAAASILLSGNVMPGEDGDWYAFKAVDQPDDGGACDQFDVRVKFLSNPGQQFVMDFYRGSCGAAQQLCTQIDTDVGWNVSFGGQPPYGPQHQNGVTTGTVVVSPAPEVGGECKCTKEPGVPGMNICTDNTSEFFVRIYRKPDMPATCDTYKISIDNSHADGP